MKSIGAMGLVGALVITASARAEASVPTAGLRPVPMKQSGATLFLRDARLADRGHRPGAPPRALARQALAGLPSPRLDRAELVPVGEDRFGTGETVVRFEETWGGLPVVGSAASALLGANGSLEMAIVDLAPSLPGSIVPVVSRAAAADEARRLFPLPVDPTDAHLVVFRVQKEARLAWAVIPRVPNGLPTAPRVIVDAVTGDVLSARDMVVFAKGRVYPTNPTKSPATTDVEFPIAPTSGKLQNDFITSMNCVDKKTVTTLSFGGLSVPIHVCDLVQNAVPNSGEDFLYPAADTAGSAESKSDTFSEVSMYYHASRAYQFFRSLQGDATAQVVLDKPFRTISNLQLPDGYESFDLNKMKNPELPLKPFQNAFFSPKGGQLGAVFAQLYGFDAGAMWFGQGPHRDYSYDGDVVYHEFGHAVVGATLNLGFWHLDAQGAVDAPGAMNEGLADYFSSAITGDPDVGEYAVGDIGDGQKNIRTLANTDACPAALAGEVHYDSTLFSGALWSVRAGLPEADRNKLDAAFYKAMRLNVGKGDVGYEDVATLFAAVVATDLPSASASFDAEMKKRGILPGCDRVIAASGKAIQSPFSRFGFASPGHGSIGKKSGTMPGLFQAKVALKEGKGRKLSVAFTNVPQGGAASALGGGGGTPFTPVALVKFGGAIVWSEAVAHDAEAEVAVVKEGQTYAADVEVPDEATEVYVQIANTGDADGAYDGLSLTVNGEEGEPSDEKGDDDDDDDDKKKKSSKDAAASEDSGCAVGSSGTERGTFALGVLGVVGLAARLRRRKA